MSDPADSPIDDELQFERAEFAGPSPELPACAACKRPIPDAYYTINGTVLCRDCQGQVLAQWKGGPRLGRFLKATLLGIGASVAGFAIYFGVLKITGLEIGLISILVGLLVGGAVRKGSGGRGGFVYQALAIFLTYSAIVASYSAVALPILFEKALAQPRARPAGKAVAPAPGPGGEVAGPGKEAEKPAVGEPEEDADEEAPARPPTPGGLAIALVMLLGLLYAIPVIVGFQNPIGLLIIGFALWEAWKINKRTRLEALGPFAVGKGPDWVLADA